MTQENEIKRPIRDLEHEPIKPLDNSEKGSKVSRALETVTTTAEKVQRQPVIAHLIRATERFNDRLGNQFGAAITYFSFLSMIPIFDGVVCRRGALCWPPIRCCYRISSTKFCKTSAIRH